jgi:hypothetical protein
MKAPPPANWIWLHTLEVVAQLGPQLNPAEQEELARLMLACARSAIDDLVRTSIERQQNAAAGSEYWLP